jgi:phosphoenolpyruvate carboxylase
MDARMNIHHWFGLTYSNYLVLPRAVLQSMPEEWQERFVAMLDELEEAAARAKLEVPAHYRVHVVDAKGRFIRDPIPHYRRAPNLLHG